MQRHHEAQTAAALLPTLAMLIPAAGVLWARVVALRGSDKRAEKAEGSE